MTILSSILSLLLGGASPAPTQQDVDLREFGWELVSTRPTSYQDGLTLRTWIAPASIRPHAERAGVFTVLSTIEQRYAGGAQGWIGSMSHTIDCHDRTWQIEWATTVSKGRPFINYLTDSQRGSPEPSVEGTGMAAVVDRVCAEFGSSDL